MRSALFAGVLLLVSLAAESAQAQYLVPNLGQPYGGTWRWTQPAMPQPYYGGYYGGYYQPSYGSGASSAYVRPYLRRDGSYVPGHYRSSPDGNLCNNWSTWPNVNPYTGKPGYQRYPRYR